MKNIQWLSADALERWDGFVEGHPFGWICHLSGWKRVLEKCFPHIQGHIVAVVDEATGCIEAGLPVYQVTSLLTGNRLVCAPFATLFDPLVSNPGHSRLLLQALLDLQAKTNARRIELRTLHSRNLFAPPELEPYCAYKLHELALTGSHDSIMSTFNYSSIRQNIKRAAKIPLRSYLVETPEHLAEFYELHCANRKRLGLPAIPLRFFAALRDEFAGSNRAVFMLAAYGDTPVAAFAGFLFNRRLSLDYLGWDTAFKRLSPSPFILWQGIKHALDAGCTVFDFGRTSVHNKGLLAYKRKWGTRELDLVEYGYPAQAGKARAADRESSRKYQLARYASRVAPDRLYKLLSGFCYQHMG